MGLGYYTKVRVTDFGPYVTKLVLPFPGKVNTTDLSKEMWSVFVERRGDMGEVLMLPRNWISRDIKEPARGYADVTGCYACDAQGEPCGCSDYVALELAIGPSHSLVAEISAPDGRNVSIISDYHISLLAPVKTESSTISGLVWDEKFGTICKDYCDFKDTISHDPQMPIRYGYYVPQGKAPKKPLIVWLHGGGEGGFETKIAYMANKAAALASEEIQQVFGGAYVFVPQCPTLWMHDGDEIYGRTGGTNYAKPLKAAIDEFIELNPGIDTNRIYIGGDSNGGFMTMRMIVDYPDFFAAAFPVCEILYDELITDEQIEKMKDLPIWFIHAKNDPVVLPGETVVPTYERLMRAGAEKVHFSYFDKIVDQHEGFLDAEGKPYEYIGHFSWIPLFERDCNFDYDGSPVMHDGRQIDVFEWLNLQSR